MAINEHMTRLIGDAVLLATVYAGGVLFFGMLLAGVLLWWLEGRGK